jgi:hypothetical protein
VSESGIASHLRRFINDRRADLTLAVMSGLPHDEYQATLRRVEELNIIEAEIASIMKDIYGVGSG